MIKLYQYENCPFCVRVRNFMDKHKIEYEKIEVDPFNKPKEVTSTGGTVPVIEDGEVIMSQSLEVIKYLRKKFEIND